MTKNCPECGIDLSTKNPKTHAFTHWGVRAEDAGTLPPAAKARYDEILKVS